MIKNENINLIYFNKTFNKSRLKKLIYWSINLFGEKKTVDLIEILKKLGYSYSTKAGLSLSIDDLKIPLIKNKLLLNTELKLNYTNQDVEKGYLTSIEYFAQVIDVWNNTNDILKQEVINNFKVKDILNPVYMMAFSGARGNISQVRQLVGMRGLMADPSGRIINFPIQSNFREGLTLTEYVISCYGARKGVVDTALRTATSGYLTRRLVDVAQHVIIRVYDCLTLRGIFLTDLKTNNNKKLLSLKNRLIGRVLAEDIYNILPKQNLHSFFTSKNINNYILKQLKKKKVAIKNQILTTELVDILLKNKKSILVRSSLTCQDKNYVCQLCYGWSLSSNNLVSLGESVGIIAAQSIGEPGTQLTMRTFHTGGVFSGHSSNEIIATFNGQIYFPQIVNGKLVRTTHGKIAFLIKQKSFILLKSYIKIKKIHLPLFTLLFVKQGQIVFKNQVLAEPIGFITELEQSIDIFQTIYSEFSGEILFKSSKSIEKFNSINKTININLITNVNSKTGQLWVLASHKQTILKPFNLFIKTGDFIFLNSFISLYNFILLNNIRKNKFLNKNTNSLFFINLKKLEVFNFFKLIKNKTKLKYSILEFNFFIKYDYFQFTKLIKKKYFSKNKFKKLNEKYIIYSYITKDYVNNKSRKSYYFSNFNIKKNSYGLKYELFINLNSIDKISLFESKNKLYYLPLILFYFCISNKNKIKLLEKKTLIYYYYIFKIPFNFIFDLNYFYKNNLNFFYNLNINNFNLNYKTLFKLKNIKLFSNYIKIINKNKLDIKKKKNILNKKYFFLHLNGLLIDNNINIIFKNNFLFYYFFSKKKIINYFYENSCFYYKDIFLFNNINDLSFFYVNNLIALFDKFNTNASYLLFINSSLNFFILITFYKLLNRININKNYLIKQKNFYLIKNTNNLKKLINFKIYFNKKLNFWSFYFLLPYLKTTINNNNNFLNACNKIKNKNYLIFIFKNFNIRKEKDLFFYNFSINIIQFYKQIKLLNTVYLEKKLNINKQKILLYDKINFNKFNIYLLKSNLYYLNYFNYLFLSFLFYLNRDKKIENNLLNKINKLYYNKSFLFFNIKRINLKKLIYKNFILKQNNIIYFKINNNINYKIKENELNKNYFILFYFILFNLNVLNINNNKKFNLKLKIKELYLIESKINNTFLKNNKSNKKKLLYLKKEIIYFYFSSYIFYFLLSNLKLTSFNYKKLYNFNFYKIFLKFLKLKKINNISKNLKILYFFKQNINIVNIRYNLLFYNMIFYKFIKNINFILIIFYKFIKTINNKKIYFLKKNINKYFFSNFSINNKISYSNLFNLFFNYKTLIFDDFLLSNNNNYTHKNLKKLIYIKNFYYKKKIKKIYLFLNKKKSFNFNISTIWVSKINKLRTKFSYKKIIKYKYYNLNNFKIKNNNKNFKIKFNNFNLLLSFKINYLNNKCYKNFYYYKKLNFLLIKKIKIFKLKDKNTINYKINYFYYLINNKILNKINYINFKKNIHKDINSLNKFLNLLVKYENIIYFINLNSIFKNKWIFYFNNLNLNIMNIKINFSFFYKLFFINYNSRKNKITLKKESYSINFFNKNKKFIINKQNNYTIFIFKNYWIINYFQKNILLFNKFDNYYNYWLFYKANFNLLKIIDFSFKINNKKILFLFNNKYNLKNILLLPIQTLYLFKIQSKINLKKNNKSLILLYLLFNFNKNKKIEIKKNSVFNFFKLKYFNFKIKYFLTKYNNLYIEKIFLFNFNIILTSNLYNFKNDYILNLKNKKLQKKFKFIFNKNNKNQKKTKLIKFYNGWFYISNKLDFLFLNSKKIIPNGFFINKFILFENKITLNKFFTFRFKNILFKNVFNFRVYLIKSFINFKIKKTLLNSFFIFYGSRFFNIYLQKSIINFNNFIFYFYKIKNNQKTINFYTNKWFILTQFYFYKIKLNNFIYNKKIINNKKLNTKILNNYCRILFLQISRLKKVKNCFYFSVKSLILIKNNIFDKKNYLKKSFINSHLLINNFLIIKNSFINYKRIFLINYSKIIFNNYNRYKPKLLIYKITFNSYNLKFKFSKFKNICLIQKGNYFNNLNIISESLVSINNKLLLSYNDLRYYIIKFPFKNLIKINRFKKSFVSNKKEKINNLFKIIYCNYLFLNKNKIKLSNIFLFKNNKRKIYLYNSLLLFINKQRYKNFFNLFYLKGYKYLDKINTYKLINIKKYLNRKRNFIFFIINKKNLIIFFIYNKKNNLKISKLFLIKTEENCFFNFNISNSSYVYFYKTKNNNYSKKYSTIKIIYKKFNNNILHFSKKFNINCNYINKIKSENYSSNIYINFKPFLIENNNFLIQLDNIINVYSSNILLLTSLNKMYNNIFNKLKLIKIKKISINFNNYKNLNLLTHNKIKKLNNKLNSQLSIFKGEILNTYTLSFFYNYLKKNKNIKTINNIFNFKYNLKEKISLFPEIFYLTNDDLLTYKITNNNKFKIKLGEFVTCSKEILFNYSINQSGQIIFLSKNKILLRRAKVLLLSAGCICNLKQGDFINNNSPLLTLTYKNLKTEDIVQGIPKIEQIFEARENLKDKFSLNSLIKLKFKNYKKIYSKTEAVHRSIIFIQQYIVDSVQKVYQSQGVNISDKHIEIIVKQMTSKVKITDPGNTGLLRGDIVYLDWIELINNGLKSKKSQYEPIILGISKACLEMDGFISAASFQETIKILSKAAILQKRDFLRGLKENLILGHLVPVGTGFEFIN
jgi:hypothetical protein